MYEPAYQLCSRGKEAENWYFQKMDLLCNAMYSDIMR